MVGCPSEKLSLGQPESFPRCIPLLQCLCTVSPGAWPAKEGRVNPLARISVFLYLPLARCSQTRMDSGLWLLLLEFVCPSKVAQLLFTTLLNESLFMSAWAPALPDQAFLSAFHKNTRANRTNLELPYLGENSSPETEAAATADLPSLSQCHPQ